jgi:hypothetical protein
MPFNLPPTKIDETQHATDCIAGHYGEFTGYLHRVNGKLVMICDECAASVEVTAAIMAGSEPIEAFESHIRYRIRKPIN